MAKSIVKAVNEREKVMSRIVNFRLHINVDRDDWQELERNVSTFNVVATFDVPCQAQVIFDIVLAM